MGFSLQTNPCIASQKNRHQKNIHACDAGFFRIILPGASPLATNILHLWCKKEFKPITKKYVSSSFPKSQT